MERRQFMSLLGGAALAPLATLPLCAEPTDGCSAPAERDDGWPVAPVTEDKLPTLTTALEESNSYVNLLATK